MGLEYGAGIDLWWPAATVFKAIWGGALVPPSWRHEVERELIHHRDCRDSSSRL